MLRLLLLATAATVGAAPLAAPRAPDRPAADTPAVRAVSIRFAATVAGRPFACGERYADLGTSRATATASDFRFYVHDVRLVRADGSTVPVQLADEAPWQHAGVALLDFEDGSGPCASGTAERRDVVTGTVPAGEYRGVRFTVGVPFERNHLDLTAQPAPLSLTRLYWAWNAGYKFMRVDMRATPAAGGAAPATWMIHLGSTDCTPSGSATTPPTACGHANRAEIALDAFDAATDVVELDLARLVAGADLLRNQERTAAGCMSGQTDADCAPVFAALGLPHERRDAAAPVVPAFQVVKGASAAIGAAPNP